MTLSFITSYLRNAVCNELIPVFHRHPRFNDQQQLFTSELLELLKMEVSSNARGSAVKIDISWDLWTLQCWYLLWLCCRFVPKGNCSYKLLMHLFAKNALECRFWLYYTTCIGGYYVSSDKVDYCMGYSSSSYPSYNHYHYHFYPQSTQYSYCPGRFSFALLIGQF